MPIYDYHCEANDQTVEVMHSMNEKMLTWGELCDKAGTAIGKTPPETLVTRILTSSFSITKPEAPRFDPSILPK